MARAAGRLHGGGVFLLVALALLLVGCGGTTDAAPADGGVEADTGTCEAHGVAADGGAFDRYWPALPDGGCGL